MDIYLRKIEARGATVYLHVTADKEVHAYALRKTGRYVDRTVAGYDGPSWEQGKAAANQLLMEFR